MYNVLRGRELGAPPLILRNTEVSRRTYSIDLSRRSLDWPHASPISWLDLDRSESHFAIVGGMSGEVAVYDVLGEGEGPVLPVLEVRAGRRAGVSSAQWFASDSGAFMTATYGGALSVWDANEAKEVAKYQFPSGGALNNAQMPTLPTTHMLIAAAMSQNQVNLCDLRSGNTTHVIAGHTADVKCVQWCPSGEHTLASAGADGTVRFWDVRRAGCLFVLDRLRTSADVRESRRALSHRGAVNGLCFSPDGALLYSCGADGVARWDVHRRLNTVVHFAGSAARELVTVRPELSSDGSVLYMPSGKLVTAYDSSTGEVLDTLQGHFGPELFSAGVDPSVLVWAPTEEDEGGRKGDDEDKDSWSD
eukprot:m51a1_g1935 putative dna excision repair protein ercc-8 (362) ;mRNA; r:917699-919273